LRRLKKGSKLVKTLSVAAAVTALSLGTVTAYADSGFDYIRVNDSELRIEDLATNDYYRQAVINAFNAADPLLVRGAAGDWVEISEGATFETGFQTLVDENHELFPYL